MVELIASLALTGTMATWMAPTAESVLDGWATFYGPGVMEEVAINRLLISRVDDYPAFLEAQGLAGLVALNRAGDLGRRVWLQQAFHAVEGPFLVVDCARALDYPQRIDDSRIVEIDWPTARRWAMDSPIPVRVFFYPSTPSLGTRSDPSDPRAYSPGNVLHIPV